MAKKGFLLPCLPLRAFSIHFLSEGWGATFVVFVFPSDWDRDGGEDYLVFSGLKMPCGRGIDEGRGKTNGNAVQLAKNILVD